MSSATYMLAFGFGPQEVLLLLVVMIFVFGPKRIPEIGESVGKALKGFRSANKEDEVPRIEEPSKEDSSKDS